MNYFQAKWKDDIRQAFWYAIQTGKKAETLMNLEKPSKNKYSVRLNSVIMIYRLSIEVWKIGPLTKL